MPWGAMNVIRVDGGTVSLRITGEAHVTAEPALFFDEADPLRSGIAERTR